MFASIVINVGNSKKPWEDVPIEVLIEEERKKKAAQEDQREQLQIPAPYYPEQTPEENPENELEGDHKIIIKFL
jgi:hypothetical protein